MQEAILITILTLALCFLGLNFVVKKWPVPLISMILFIFVGFGAANTQNVFCAEIVGSFDCVTNSTFNNELVILAGVFVLIAAIMAILRYVSEPIENNSLED